VQIKHFFAVVSVLGSSNCDQA